VTTLFLVLQVVFAVIITISVLLQKSSSIGLGAYSGSNESLFGAKGPAGFLAKFTAAMGILFVINTMALAYFYQKESKSSIIDKIKIENNATLPALPNAVPSAPVLPSTPSDIAPQAPSAPTGNANPQTMGDTTTPSASDDSSKTPSAQSSGMSSQNDTHAASPQSGTEIPSAGYAPQSADMNAKADDANSSTTSSSAK